MERLLIMIGTGGLVGVVGVLIKYAGWMNLIAGYDPDRVDDDEGLADFIGAYTLYIALLTVLVGVLDYAMDADWYWLVYGIAVFGLSGWMIRGSRRYESPPENSTDA